MRVLCLATEYPPAHGYGLGRYTYEHCQALAAAGAEVTVVCNNHDGSRDHYRDGAVEVWNVPFALPFHGYDTASDVLQGNVTLFTRAAELLAASPARAWSAGSPARSGSGADPAPPPGGAELQPAHSVVAPGGSSPTPGAPPRTPPFDVLQANDWLAASAAVALRDTFRLPLIVTMHETELGKRLGPPTPEGDYVAAMERWVCEQADAVAANSEALRRELIEAYGVPGERITVVGCGVRPECFEVDVDRAAFRSLFCQPGERLILFVGRLTPIKGPQVLLEAMPQLLAVHPDVHLVLAGEGTSQEALAARASELGLAGRVHLVGYLRGRVLAAMYRAADVLAVPSLYEPLGMVALEGAVCGTPLVVADAGGLGEIVTDAETGLKVPPNDPQALAAALARELTRPGVPVSLAQAARRELVQRYSWARVADRTLGLCAHLVQARGAKPPAQAASSPGAAASLAPTEAPDRIVLRRGGGIGDIVMTTPAVAFLRSRYPQARIEYVTNPAYFELLALSPSIDVLSGDAVLDGRTREIVLQHDGVWESGTHVIDHYLSLVGAPPGASRRPILALAEADRQWACGLIANLPRPAVLVHPKSNMPSRDWPLEHWRRLVSWLSERYAVLQVGASADPLLDGVVDCRCPAGPAPLRRTAALVGAAALVVAVDSCAQHFAAAMGTTAVALYGGASSPGLSGYAEHVNLITPSSCRCTLSRYGGPCPRSHHCMRALAPDTVIERIEAISPGVTR